MSRKMTILLIAYAVVFAALAVELPAGLANGGFDGANGSDGWELPSAGWSVVPGAGRQGSEGLVWECQDAKAYSFPKFSFRAEPGGIYRFGGFVKVDSLVGEKSRPSVCIDWSDADGKWLASAYARPVADNDPKSDGWVRYEGETPYLPAKAYTANVLCYLPRGSVGRVRFDDFWLEAIPPRPVGYLQCAAYKNEFARGDAPVRFVALLHVNPLKNPIESLRGELVFCGGDGRRQIVVADVLDLTHAEVAVPSARFALGAQVATFRLVSRSDGAEVGTASLKIRCTESPRPRRVAIDAKGRALLDGKPFFPLGLYAGRMTDEDLAVWKTGPFNFAVQYGEVSVRDLDRWQSIGVHVAVDVRRFIYGYDYSAKSPYKTFAESQEALRKYFAAVGGHPALFAWYLVDEAPLRFVPNIRDVNEFLHELDPDHPTYTVTDKPRDIQPLLPCFDVVGVDPYPIGNSDGRGNVAICSEWADIARCGSFGMRAAWHVPQAFNWGWYRKNDAATSRMPSRAEMANMTWQLVASGANGLCAYAFYSMRGKLVGDDFANAWADVCTVASEVKSVERVLLSDGLAPSFGGIPERTLAVRTFRLDGEDWMVVANRTSGAVRATLETPCDYVRLETVFGGGVSLLGGRRVGIDFPPLGYAVVRLTGQAQ